MVMVKTLFIHDKKQQPKYVDKHDITIKTKVYMKNNRA